jgi:hypothetical protein
MVQPRVPWPVLSQRLGMRVAPTRGTLEAWKGEGPPVAAPVAGLGEEDSRAHQRSAPVQVRRPAGELRRPAMRILSPARITIFASSSVAHARCPVGTPPPPSPSSPAG